MALGFEAHVVFHDRRSTLVYLWISQKQRYHRFYFDGEVFIA